MFADLDGNGVVGSTEILQENHYYPFGMNMEGPWLNNSATKDSKYQYNGKELNEDFGLNWNDYGARWYDAAVARWNVIDPSLENYFATSPYVYALNCPTLYIDPNGEYVDVSDILRKKKGEYVNKEQAEAFMKFAKSDVGKEFLSMFASKGQVIPGHEYTKSGVFDKQGFDLSFSTRNLNYSSSDGDSRLSWGPNGITEKSEDKNGGLSLNIVLNNAENISNDYSKNFFANKNDPKSKLNYELDMATTLFHEAFIHAKPFALDKADDCNINCSIFSSEHGYKQANDPRGKKRNQIHHLAARKSGSDFSKKVIPAILSMYKQYGSGLSTSKIQSNINEFKD
jgi:RHS repeat-associated protein